MARRTTRRRFIQESAAAGLGFWVAGGVALGARAKPPTTRSTSPASASAARATATATRPASYGNIVAICDIDDNTLEQARPTSFPKAKKYNDYRKMLDEMGKEIDAVTVSTPDHTHAPASHHGHEDGQARLLPEAADAHRLRSPRRCARSRPEMKVATQMGNQGTAENGLREAVEIIQAGVIGPVARGPRLDQPADLAAGAGRHGPAQGRQPVPKNVHWDVWLGAGARRARTSRRLPPVQLARLVGLRHRRPGRHGLPHRQHGLHGPEARLSRPASWPRPAT